jgi:3-hydroxyacyl-CoA dehydrogenase/enoyl-CoA hydratase/3-hydroxybutyryl-CoA epimerase
MKRVLLAQLARQLRREHYPAPFAIVEQWARYGSSDTAFEAEAQSIARLFETETAHGLVRVFLLQDRLKSLGNQPTPELRHVHVVGAGVMGGDIAAWCALRGFDVTLQDRELQFIEPALARAAKLFEKRIRDPEERRVASKRLTADVAGDGIASADVLIEAIFENLEAKRALFKSAEARLPATAIVATNTSSLTLESIAAPLDDPGRLVGLHFFNPVPQMPLVEVIHSVQSRPEAVARALAFTRRIDKLPLPCRSGPGFLVNRVLFPYLHEALHAAGEGVPLPLIDRAALDFGMPMGPIELADVVGLDVMLHVGEIITHELQRESPPFVAELRRRVEARQLGRKSGQGFYAWQDGKPQKPAVEGSPPADLADRMILALVNECMACLREGVVADEDLLDAGIVFGTGFAPFRGGPLHYARRRGPHEVMARLAQFATHYGSRFEPDAGWTQFAATPAST